MPTKFSPHTESARMSPEVTENKPQHRFEIPIVHDAIAAAYYREDRDRVVLIHTEVPSEHWNEGWASKVAAGALDIIRATGRRAVLKCPFMAAYYVRHPEYSDIVDG
jgi:predicted GNAT family acetyltransferase